MKKLIFSLVAMIAFSSFAMANNVEVETVKAEVECNLKTLEVQLQTNNFNSVKVAPCHWITLINVPCLVAAAQVHAAYSQTSLSPEVVNDIAWGVYLGCTGQLPSR